MSYWGMPYQGYAAERLMKWLNDHNFEPLGNAFDFCLLDTTSYNDKMCIRDRPATGQSAMRPEHREGRRL